MRRTLLLGSVVAFPVLLIAMEAFGTLGWNQKAFEDTCFQFVSQPDRLPYVQITPEMRALAMVQRRAAAESIGARAKAYYASEAFQKRWAEHRSHFTGGEEQERQRAQLQAQTAQYSENAIRQMEQMLPMMPPAQQEEMKKAIAKAKTDQAKVARGEDSNVPPKDPKVALKKSLQHLLAVTDGIDYAAAISNHDGRRYFSNAAFESKSSEWKMGYRAGREATEGLRTYIRNWIAELKP